MPLDESQKREVIQLLLVALAYLRLASPPTTFEDLTLSNAASAFSKATLDDFDWAQTMLGANLASSAVRLASADELLEKTQTGSRHVYTECRAYFRKGSKARLSDTRGSTCSEWFHIMLRDAIGHRERDTTSDATQKTRYDDRQICIERTSFRYAHTRLQQTAEELVSILKVEGIFLPAVPKL